MGISSTIQLHHQVPQDVRTLKCWCPQSTGCRWRSQFRQGRKYRRRGHRLYHRNTEFASDTNRLGYVAERVFSRSNFDEGHAFHERRLAWEKIRRWPTREIPQNRRLSVFHGCLLVWSPSGDSDQATSSSARSFARMPFRHPTDEAVGKDSRLLAEHRFLHSRSMLAMSDLRRASVRTVESCVHP